MHFILNNMARQLTGPSKKVLQKVDSIVASRPTLPAISVKKEDWLELVKAVNANLKTHRKPQLEGVTGFKHGKVLIQKAL